jgi:hypothetical protein
VQDRMVTLLVTALAEVLLEPPDSLTDSARTKLRKLRLRVLLVPKQPALLG